MGRGQSKMMRGGLLLLWLGAALCVSGCGQPYQHALRGGLEDPPDFSLDFRIHGPATGADRRQQASRYILLPDRTLYLALGAGAAAPGLPAHRLTLTPSQVRKVLDVIHEASLHVEPTSPLGAKLGQPDAAAVTYELAINAWGRTHRYRTTMLESPPTRKLLELLIAYTGGSVDPWVEQP